MKRNAHLTFGFIIAAMTIGGAVAEAAVNCGEVLRSLNAGASPRQVADTMAISMADVKDCQDKAEVESADKNGKNGATLENDGSDEERSVNQTSGQNF